MTDRPANGMEFKLVVPTEILVEDRVVKVTAQAVDGSFTVLPRHIDFVSVLEPGLLSYETAGGNRETVALDGGAFVKQGDRIIVSTYTAVRHRDIVQLKRAVRSFFEDIDEKEKKARSALARMEADLVTRLGGTEPTET